MPRKTTGGGAGLRAASSNAPLYQLKITLDESQPPIWRRVIVRAAMRLDRLDDVIQLAMGWTHSHMHQFMAGAGASPVRYGSTGLGFGEGGADTLDERHYTVADLAPRAKSKFFYEYDFGDSWQHEILLEKILPPDPSFKHPVCLAGANAGPPEDCGGIGGYYDLLKVMADPKHPDHEEMKEWIGGEWDPARFDLKELNSAFRRVKA